ncbi:diguanylate cyclase [Oscillibacter sp.]|uniref:GGDEF domain-containing protein n=1 Tax=Oscillibacter sp. TaxID=1945593 RepID=UPI00339A51FC
MSKRRLTNSQIVQMKYKDIINAWMNIHLLIMFGMILVAVVMECLVYFMLGSFHVPVTTAAQYMRRYMLTPLCLNLLLLSVALLIRRSAKLSETVRAGAVSLSAAGMGLVLYTVHRIFPAMSLALIVPVILTIFYGRVNLTALIGAVCIVGKLFSDLFFNWDPDVTPSGLTGEAAVDQFVCLFLLAICSLVSILLVRMYRQRIDSSVNAMLEQQRLRKKTITDSLTRVGNRRALEETLRKMESRNCGQWFFAMMDIDQFKHVNDQLGHSRGDHYLQCLGRILLCYEDGTFQPFRFGGDEFCAIMQKKSLEEAIAVCHRLQSDFIHAVEEDAKLISSGISIGLTACDSSEDSQSILNRADAALYQAKKVQRGGVSLWGPEQEKAECI